MTSLGAPVSNSNFYYEPLCWLWDFYLDLDFGLLTPTPDSSNSRLGLEFDKKLTASPLTYMDFLYNMPALHYQFENDHYGVYVVPNVAPHVHLGGVLDTQQDS